MKFLINISIFITLMSSALLGQSIKVSIPNVQGTVEDLIMAPLNIGEDISEKGIFSFQFEIDYASHIIEFKGIEKLGTITENMNNLVFHSVPGKINVSGISATELSGSGALFKLKFKLLKKGTSNLTFNSDTVNNFFNEGSPFISLTNGRIQVLAIPTISISPKSGELAIGETLKFRASGGTQPYTWNVSDPKLASIDSEGLLTADAQGMVDIIATDALGYKGKLEGIGIRSFTLQIRDTSYYQNNFVEIPILFRNLDQTDVYSGEFSLAYSTNILEFDKFIIDNSHMFSPNIVQHHSVPGVISFSFALPAPVKISGEIAKLRFKIADRQSGATYFTMENGMINEDMNVKFYQGRFSIIRLPILILKPLTSQLLTGETKQFTVTGGFEPYEWSVTHAEQASIDQSGLLTAQSGGTTQVIVKDKLGASASSDIIDIYDTWVAVRDSTADIHNYHMMLPMDIGVLPPNKPVVASSGKVKYQSDAIDSIKLITTNSLSASWMAASRSDQRVTNISIAGTESLTHTGGVLVYLHIYFNGSLKTNSRIYFDLEDYYLNEGTPRTKTKRGTLKVGTVTALTKLKDMNRTLVAYPNPANDVLSIKNNGNFRLKSFVIFDLSGKSIQNGQFSEDTYSDFIIDISDLRSGTYMILINKSNGHDENMRFIKQ